MNGWDLVQAEAFDTHQKKKNKKQKTRQASGIQEWPGHFKWRKNARIEKGGDFGDDLNLPSESWTVRTGDFYFNGLIIPKKERPRESKMSLLQPYSS